MKMLNKVFRKIIKSVQKTIIRGRGRGRGFESRSEPEIFSGLCSSSVTAALALMTVTTQLLLLDYLGQV